MKLFMFFVNTIYWLSLFIVPVGILSFIAFWIYAKNNENLPYSIVLSIAGTILGIFFAEKVRKIYGLSNFFGRIASSSDLGKNNSLTEKEEDQKDHK